MATADIYGPYMDRRGVTKRAKKLRESLECDTFVTATANHKYQAWTADFPGDRPLAGYTVVEAFHYVPPLPVEATEREELLHLLRQLDYEVNHNPAPIGDGGMAADDICSLLSRAFELGLAERVARSAP